MKKILIVTFILVMLSAIGSLLASKLIEDGFSLSVSPEEFERTTTISVNLIENMEVNLVILDEKDIVVKVLFQGTLKSGETLFTWDGTDYKGSRLTEGKYQVELSGMAKYTSLKKIIILK